MTYKVVLLSDLLDESVKSGMSESGLNKMEDDGWELQHITTSHLPTDPFYIFRKMPEMPDFQPSVPRMNDPFS
jgi:hypothetical protein